MDELNIKLTLEELKILKDVLSSVEFSLNDDNKLLEDIYNKVVIAIEEITA